LQKENFKEIAKQVSEVAMSVDAKKTMGWMMVLIALGVVAFCAGPQWLAILVPAAILVWYGAAPLVNKSSARSGRN
jgi:hypothetical protein